MNRLSTLIFQALLILAVSSTAPSLDAYAQAEIKFVPEDGETYDGFGRAIATDGYWAFIGSDRHEVGDNSGAVYLYQLQGDTWVLYDKITPVDDSEVHRFGDDIALDGNRVLIGASGNFENNSAAFIFEYIGGTWTQMAKLVSEDATGFGDFGETVALYGDVAVIGARTQDYPVGPGAAYVFEKQGDAWVQAAKLVPDDGLPFDWFGTSVSLFKNRIAIGANGADGNSEGSGVVYIYEHKQGEWIQTAKLQSSNGGFFELFGDTVCLVRNRLVIGDPFASTNGSSDGAVYIFEYHNGEWTETAKLLASDGTNKDVFGSAISMSGNKILIGASGDGDDRGIGPDAGAAYLFEYRRGSWVEVQKIVPSDAFAFDLFGDEVALYGDLAIMGAPINVLSSFLTDNPGAAYFFDLSAMEIEGEMTAQADRALTIDENTESVYAFALHENYPNPFNPTTVISFSVHETAHVRLTVYDMLGREVERLVDHVQEPGAYEVSFDATGLPGGMYLYRLETPAGSQTQSMLLLK